MQQSPPAPGAPPRVPLLSCRGLLIGYEKPIVPPIDLDMYENDLWAVVGINGSGKSTWMRTALGLERPLGGTVTLSPGTRVAYVPQAAALDPIYPIRVCDVVLMGLMKPGRVGGFLRQGDRELAREALAKVRAEALYDRPFRDLSGGQRQRVLIARALASKAQVFFLDEPTSALDRPAEEQVLELIDDLQRIPGAAVALITHHLQVLRGIADHALLVDRESNSVMAGTADEVSHSPLFHRLFGDAIGTWPSAARKP